MYLWILVLFTTAARGGQEVIINIIIIIASFCFSTEWYKLNFLDTRLVFGIWFVKMCSCVQEKFFGYQHLSRFTIYIASTWSLLSNTYFIFMTRLLILIKWAVSQLQKIKHYYTESPRIHDQHFGITTAASFLRHIMITEAVF